MEVIPTVPGQKVLIIDDAPANLEIVSKYLEGARFEIMVAQDGGTGLDIAQGAHPDLILLDVMMPGMDGFETCRRLKANEQTRDIPVIFLTSLTDRELIIKGFEVGGVDYITKPVRMGEVLARARTHATLRATQKQLTVQNLQLQREITVRTQVEEELRAVQSELELRVEQRTAELAQTNATLKAEIVERRHAEERLRDRNRELALLNAVIAASVTQTSIDTFLAFACRELAHGFGVPQARAALINESRSEAVIVAEYLDEGRPSALHATLRVANVQLPQDMLTHNTTLVADDVPNDPRLAFFREFSLQHKVASLLVVPLLLNEAVFGFLGLESVQKRQFAPAEISLAEIKRVVAPEARRRAP
jgi:DNA-binding response OmpR family regulator